MIETVRKAWNIPELRKKIFFTCTMLLLFRVGSQIPVPYVDAAALAESIESMSTTVLGLYNAMSGGAFAMATLFALGVQPYINASIIIQLLTIAIPAMERLAKEGGEEGRKKIASITRYATVGIALLQGFGYYMLMKNWNILTDTGIWAALVIIVSFMAGSSLVMWMGEQITEFGIGNGISIILFAGIISRVPSMVGSMISGVQLWFAQRAGELSVESLIASGYTEVDAQAYMDQIVSPWGVALILVGVSALVLLITFVNGGERRIPVQYAKRQVGRRMYGGQSSHLPMKVNMSGVLPVIFAQSIAMLPATIMAFTGVGPEGSFSYAISQFIDTQSLVYMAIYFLMIIGFSYFYATIQFNPIEISNNLKKQGGFVPGFRPGKPTSDFITKVLKNITLFGAIYLGIVALSPLFIGKVVSNANLAIGGTSVIIVVGVALETVRGLENQMMMRQYKGFLE